MSFGGGAGITAEQKFKTMKVERITTDEGDARAIIFGKVRGIVGQLIWAGKIRLEWQYAGDVEVGKDSEETYKQVPFRHYAIGICEAEGNVELSKIWRNNKLVYDASRAGWAQNARFMQKTTFYNGAYTQLPNATMETALGAGNVPAFRGTAYMVRRNINLEAFQGAVPQYVFEVDATYIPPAPSGSADLKITVEAVPDEVIVGDTITVTYTVENLGVDDSESAVVNFTSNPELSIVSSTLSKGSLAGGVWTIGDIANGTSETAEIVYESVDDGIITVGATVSAATPDPDLLNNYDFHTVEIAVGYDPDAQAIIDRMIPEPSAALKDRLNAFVVGLKNPALWSASGAMWYRLDSLFVPATAQNEQSGALDWKRSVSAVFYGGAGWSASLGFTNDGVTGSHIDSGFNPSIHGVNFTLHAASIGGIITRWPTISGAAVVGGYTSASNNTSLSTTGAVSSHTVQGYISSNSNAFVSGASGAIGDILGVNRTNAPRVGLQRNGAEIGTARTTAPTGILTTTIGILARHNTTNAGGWDGNSDGAVGMTYFGGAMTATEQSMLKSLYNAYVAAA